MFRCVPDSYPEKFGNAIRHTAERGLVDSARPNREFERVTGMARVIVYAENDRVIYNSGREEFRAVIVSVHAIPGVAFSGGFEYTIRITSNKGKAYRSGDVFRTTAGFLARTKSRTTKTVTATERKNAERKRAERHTMAQLAELHKQLMR